MSEQAKILVEMQKIIMSILTSGSASQEEGQRIDELEVLLHQQKCYKEIEHKEYHYLGEEIIGFFVNNKYSEAIEKMCHSNITPQDFFGFVEYHDEEEEFLEFFTQEFMEKVNSDYEAKNLSF